MKILNLEFIFDQEYKDLKGWEIFEFNKTSVKVKILKIRKIENLEKMDENIFKFLEFMRADKKGFLGPYERKIKKFLQEKKLTYLIKL